MEALIVNILGNMKDCVLNAVFPRFCIRCNKEGNLLCKRCMVLWEPRVPIIQNDNVAMFAYADPVVRDLVRAWKYHFDFSAWQVLQIKMQSRLNHIVGLIDAHKIEAIVPLPLYEKRLCERGFDQAVEIANFLSVELNIPVIHVLHRKKSTGKQSERSTEDRKKYMQKSPFIAIQKSPKSVLLVDDVWTTGATSKAATLALKSAGAEKVIIFTIARG